MFPPSLADLSGYDVAVMHYDCDYRNQDILGNNLADFVDAGGGVLTPSFDFAFPGFLGRFHSGGYQVFSSGDPFGLDDRTLGWYDAQHPIMAGVTSYTSGLYNVLGPLRAPGATLIAQYADGGDLVAAHQPSGAGWVVGVNDFMVSGAIGRPDFWDPSSSGPLWVNAAYFAGGGAPPPPFSATATGTCPGDVTMATTNGSPNSLLAVITGPPGSYTIPFGRCAGTILPTSAPRLRLVQVADPSGAWTVTTAFRSAASCGLQVMFLDAGTCAVASATIP
jgi:hypothetical protein